MRSKREGNKQYLPQRDLKSRDAEARVDVGARYSGFQALVQGEDVMQVVSTYLPASLERISPPDTSVWFFGRVGYRARLLSHVISQSEIPTVSIPIKTRQMPNELAERRPPMGSCSSSGPNEFTQLRLRAPHHL